jgi:hypothetical protein
MKELPLKIKIFFLIIYSLTILSLYFFIKASYVAVSIPDLKTLIFFGLFAVLTESFTVNFRNISFTTTFAVTTAVYFLFGPFTSIVVNLIGLTFCIFNNEGEYKHILNTPWYGTMFNYCVYTLPILFGNFIYIKLGGDFFYQNTGNIVSQDLLSIIIFAIISCTINLLIISIMFSLHFNKNIIYGLISNIKLSILNSMVMLPFSIMLAIVFLQYSYFGILLFIIPIILARYTFSLYIDSKSQYADTVDALMRAMEARDKYTEGHSQRVAELVRDIANELKYNDWTIDKLHIASLLHDVGKIGIDDSILNKPGKLTDEEYNIIKSHPEIGYGILKNVKNMKDIIHIVKHHHERYDGKGYPDGTSGNEINLDVYIVQLADCVDAMSTDRPYRTALTPEQIVSELEINSGTQFHPRVVDAYINLMKKQNKKIQR